MERVEISIEAPLGRTPDHEADTVPGEVVDMLRGRVGRHHHRMGFHKDGGAGQHFAGQLLLVDLGTREKVDVVLLVAHGVEILRRLVFMVFDAFGGAEHRGGDRAADVDFEAGPAPVAVGARQARPLDAAAADDAARLHALDDGARRGVGDRTADKKQDQQE